MSNPARSALLFLLAACSGSTPETPTPPATTTGQAKPAVVATPAPTACAASASWFTNPNPPVDVASSETFCDFYQFSWQWFLAQVSPANPADPTGERAWESANRVFVPGKVNQCAMNALSGRLSAGKHLDLRDSKPEDFEDLQADSRPLYDQKGNALYYNIWYSPEECQASPTTGFVAGTMEIKTSWRVLDSADPTYLTMTATVPVIPAGGGKSTTKEVTLGLVGFHLVNWTPTHPEMIWATFEHKSNAPLCSGASTPPAGGWSLTSDAAAACLAANPSPSGTIPAECASHSFNTQPPAPSGDVAPTSGTPDEVCQLFDNGTDPGTSANGNDNAANALAIVQLNDALVGTNGLLTALPADNPMAVWANYTMIGGLWTKGGANSAEPPPVPSAQGKANPQSPQRGSLELTNMTMETYEQGETSEVPNCFGCHSYVSSAPLTVSHIATKYLLPSSTAAK
jgi:hypothetical protein